MPIKRRFIPPTEWEKHLWRIDNAKWHIKHFRNQGNAHRLKIWKGVLSILEKRTPEEVEKLASG